MSIHPRIYSETDMLSKDPLSEDLDTLVNIYLSALKIFKETLDDLKFTINYYVRPSDRVTTKYAGLILAEMESIYIIKDVVTQLLDDLKEEVSIKFSDSALFQINDYIYHLVSISGVLRPLVLCQFNLIELETVITNSKIHKSTFFNFYDSQMDLSVEKETYRLEEMLKVNYLNLKDIVFFMKKRLTFFHASIISYKETRSSFEES